MRKILRTTTRLAKITSRPLFLASTLQFNANFNTHSLLYKPINLFSGSSAQAHKNVSRSSFEGPGFYVQQFLTGCLSIYSYYIESNGEAFLIDPINDIKEYEKVLESRKIKLKGVFLSHYHADFVAGHYQLEKKFNCKVYMGPTALESHKTSIAKDGQEFNIGKIKLKVIHTPGHTSESSCLLLTDEKGKQQALFTGDTVFLNEVGRPDLAVKSDLSKQDLAGMLFDSLQKLKSIDKQVRIYPGHGAGSSCGKSIGKGDFCLMGTQMENNYGLKETNKQKFIQAVLSQMPSPPQYFGHDAYINKFSPFDYEEVQKFVSNQIKPQSIPKLIEFDGVMIIDVRPLAELKKGFIKGAINIDFDGAFANWVGTVLSPKHYYLIYGAEDIAKQSIKRLLRIGYTNIAGYTSGSIQEMGKYVTVYQGDITYEAKVPQGYTILDVRKPGEWKKSHVDGAVHLELGQLPLQYKKLDQSKKYMIHCQSGYRARIAYSFLKGKGFNPKVLINEFEQFAKNGVKMSSG